MSYIALGLNFSAIWSGQGNFLLPREIALHAARTGVAGANRLITKLTTAGHARIEGK